MSRKEIIPLLQEIVAPLLSIDFEPPFIAKQLQLLKGCYRGLHWDCYPSQQGMPPLSHGGADAFCSFTCIHATLTPHSDVLREAAPSIVPPLQKSRSRCPSPWLTALPRFSKSRTRQHWSKPHSSPADLKTALIHLQCLIMLGKMSDEKIWVMWMGLWRHIMPCR